MKNSEVMNRTLTKKMSLTSFILVIFLLFVPSLYGGDANEIKKFLLVIRKQVLANLGMRIAVNESIPGPTLYLNKGDNAEITVINEMEDEVTSVHWHGIDQIGTPYSDGVAGLTQCPIYNHSSTRNKMIYKFQVQRSGTFWYHGHVRGQYVDGLYGALIIEDASEQALLTSLGASYDTQWTLMTSDYYAQLSDGLIPHYLSPASHGDEPMPDAYLVNGHFTNTTWFHTTTNTSIRMRIINAAAYSMFNLSVDGLPLQLIELDGMAVKPLTVSSVVVNAGQRVSFIVHFASLLTSSSFRPSSLYIRATGIPFMYPEYDPSAPNLGKYAICLGTLFRTHF